MLGSGSYCLWNLTSRLFSDSGGMFAGSLSSGRILDAKFRRMKEVHKQAREGAVESSNDKGYGDDFPIEKVDALPT